MVQDERTVVRQAQNATQQSLQQHGRVLPGAVMLVQRDPATEAVLDAPTALAMSEAQPFKDADALELFIGGLRAEAARLDALAIAIIGEAAAEIEEAAAEIEAATGSEGAAPRRVALIRMEDRSGIQQLHAPIERQPSGDWRVGDFVASPEAPDILEHPILLP